MSDVARRGRTIVFVSHNMAAVKALCRRAIFIKDGAVAKSGVVSGVVDDYLSGSTSRVSVRESRDLETAPGNENIRMVYIRSMPPDGNATITIDTGMLIEIGFDSLQQNINLDCTIYVTSSDGVLVFESGHIISSDCDSRSGSYHLNRKNTGAFAQRRTLFFKRTFRQGPAPCPVPYGRCYLLPSGEHCDGKGRKYGDCAGHRPTTAVVATLL